MKKQIIQKQKEISTVKPSQNLSYPVRSYTDKELKKFLDLDKRESRPLNIKKKVKKFKILSPGELIHLQL